MLFGSEVECHRFRNFRRLRSIASASLVMLGYIGDPTRAQPEDMNLQ